VSKEKNLEAYFEMPYAGIKFMVGDGPMLEEYKANYPDVKFVGAKRGQELAKYFAMADVFVFPSRWETFGIVMIEAMACGTPVAAYPCQGPLDVIDEGITGCMNEDLVQAVHDALKLDRAKVLLGSRRWTWEECWRIFKENLVEII
jgi:glycosyltransferase involved in cell wall biosynthesis